MGEPELTQVVFYVLYLIDFFFQFYRSIFGWLGIEFHNLFCFVFL